MRNEPTGYHVSVHSESGIWRCKVRAFNKLDAAFRAGTEAEAAGIAIGRYANYYIHQDKGLGCCREREQIQ